jgi:hypothetical protein
MPGMKEDLDEAYAVPLDAFVMRLRPSELAAVASGLGEFDASEIGDQLTLGEALRRIPVRDRAPLWELATRRYARHKPLAQAAGEIGMDLVRGRALLEAFSRALAEVPPPEHAEPSRYHPTT